MRAAREVHGAGVGSGESARVRVGSDAHHELAALDTAAHVTTDHEGQTSENAPYSHRYSPNAWAKPRGS